MIFVTGDTHGDLHRFDNPVVKKMRKEDMLIICGDFGFIWEGNEQERKILEKLGKKKYQILFVDGAHENFDLLDVQRFGQAFNEMLTKINDLKVVAYD